MCASPRTSPWPIAGSRSGARAGGRCSPRSALSATILGSPHNPKFLWVDDAEIVGDRITEVRPVPGNFFTQETERRISELGACCVAFVVRDVSVHETPQPLDRIQMRAIGGKEMHFDR